ncbi:oxytocin receptor-like [Littorina saxatilis]|uniref:oxytocin receptor-like n=1 Tax=Littorina saxatilis TaxID=31220 RepID=UPI0038B54B5B
MICTIVGNLSLILALTCKRSRRIKRVNVFLVNLAIGDLAVALFTNTSEILFLAFGDWALGAAACKIIVYVQIVTLASATFLLTAMSVDRYQVIVKPMQSLANRPRIWMKVIIAWVMAFIFATPQLFIFLQITEEQGGVRRRCCVSKGYTAEWQRKVYLTFLTSYILLVPTAIMIYCYANIIHVVWIRARAEDPSGRVQHVPGMEKDEGPGSPRMSMRRGLVTASKRRVITMTLTVVVGFLVCQTPYFIVSLIRVYSDYGIKLPVLLAVSENIVLMHSTLNPVLYGLFTLRSYHLTALLECFTCQDHHVSRGERRLLLHGKYAGKSFKSSTVQNANRQIHREAVDDAMCKRNGVCFDPGLRHEESFSKGYSLCKGETAFNDNYLCKGEGVSKGEIVCKGDYLCKGESVCKDNAVCKGDSMCEGEALCKDGATCNDSAVCKSGLVCKDDSSCKDRTGCSNEPEMVVGIRQRNMCQKTEHSVPLLLIQSNSTIRDHSQNGKQPNSEDNTQHTQKRSSVRERSPGVRSEQDSVIRRGSYGNDRSSVACSQWTPSHVDTNSECYSCV